jgi:preprotein translocase subunit SecE
MATTPETPAPSPAPVRRSNFISEVFVELKKVTWPTLPEAWRLTVVVLFVIISVAIFVGAIDFVLSTLTKRFELIK